MWSDIVDAISYYALFCTGVITEQNYQQYSAKYSSFNALQLTLTEVTCYI